MSGVQLARVEGGAAAMFGAALGEAMGRPVAGLASAHATARVAPSDAGVALMTPPTTETDAMREALPGNPGAATMLGLTLVEAALCGPDPADELVEDTLRRLASVAAPRGKAVHGQLLAPSPVLGQVLKDHSQGAPFLSCAAQDADASLLAAALFLGAAGVELPRSLLLLRAVCRHPIALDAAATLAELTRLCCTQKVTPEELVKAAREAEERVFALMPSLPGTLAGPPEMGHGAMAMALARAHSSLSGVDALLPLSQDLSNAPDVLLCGVLGALMAEPHQATRHVATALRHGGVASTACSLLLGLTASLQGLKGVPLAWLGGLQHGASLVRWSEAACAPGKKAHLLHPAADLCWRWNRDEAAFRTTRDAERKAAPAPTRTEQLGLF